MEPENIIKITRNKKAIANGEDKHKYKCNIIPKVKSFQVGFFYRTVEQWNTLPIEIRKLDTIDKFSDKLKEFLWLMLGLKPD